MARPGKTGARERLNLDVSAAVRGRLLRLRDVTGADSISEVVRRACAVYEKLVEEVGAGATVVIRRGGEYRVLVLVPEAPTVHRDTKPANTLVKETPPPAARPALLDGVPVKEAEAGVAVDRAQVLAAIARSAPRDTEHAKRATFERLKATLGSKRSEPVEGEEPDTEYGPVEDI